MILLFCSQLFQNSDNRTTYTVQRREVIEGLDNTLRYPLVENMDYVVRVRNISCVYACGVGRLSDSIVIVLVPRLVHEDSFLCLVSPPSISPPPSFHHPLSPHLIFLQVFASNPTGNGLPSENVTFNTNGEC